LRSVLLELELVLLAGVLHLLRVSDDGELGRAELALWLLLHVDGIKLAHELGAQATQQGLCLPPAGLLTDIADVAKLLQLLPLLLLLRRWRLFFLAAGGAKAALAGAARAGGRRGPGLPGPGLVVARLQLARGGWQGWEVPAVLRGRSARGSRV
jgi:hypothetical protein